MDRQTKLEEGQAALAESLKTLQKRVNEEKSIHQFHLIYLIIKKQNLTNYMAWLINCLKMSKIRTSWGSSLLRGGEGY